MIERATRFGLVGAAASLALAAALVVAPSAAPTASAAVGCSSLNGVSVTAPSYSASAVVLNAGDKITVTASPVTSTQKILLSAANGLNFAFYEGFAATGVTYTAPAAGSYSLSWALAKSTEPTPANLTWTITATCSSAVVSPDPTTTVPKGKGKRK
ncbi:hypothetical protein ACSBPH_11725 [Microbacterium sp. F51-2R]|uniref:hypothetical protein n=1 Tax=Microbacterium sp. F51-2R TaxID=3445777 RepID=UPI003FA0ADEB